MKHQTQMTRRAAGLLLLASLAACGGGGGSGSGNMGDGGGDAGGDGESPGGGGDQGGTPGGGSGTVMGTYRLRPAAGSESQMLSDANMMGATGFALLSALVAGNGQSRDFYVSDTAHEGHQFAYQLQPAPATASAFVTQLNQQGSNGLRFKSFSAFGAPGAVSNLFVKNTSRTDQFSYEASASTGLSEAQWRTELNEKGARGFHWIGPAMLSNGEMLNLYVKRSDGVTYEYALEAGSNDTLANMQAHWSSQGDKGWLARGTVFLGTAAVAVYEKSSAQSGAVEYRVQSLAAGLSPEAMLDQMNANAADGFFFFSEIVDSAGVVGVISIKNAGLLDHPLAGVTFP